MTQNLKIEGAIELNSESSDIVNTFSLPAKSSNWKSTGSDIAYVHIDRAYGGYYNWFAATAGTGTLAMGSGEASNSICSKGWRLPTIYDFLNLYDVYSGCQQLISGIPNFNKTGIFEYNYSENQYNSQGTYAAFQTSTALSGSGSGFTWFSEGTTRNNMICDYRQNCGNTGKTRGFAIRCVKR